MKPCDQHRHIPPAAELIPRHWTPEQALAAFELLDQLRDLVWQCYSREIQSCLREQQRADASPPTDPPF
ncbi:MAG: hypothetical protein ABIQ03_04375 [Burkholderiales bacterium]